MGVLDNENVKRTTEFIPEFHPKNILSQKDKNKTITSDGQTPSESGPDTPTRTPEKQDSSVNDENNSQASVAETPPESGPNTSTSTSEKQSSSVNGTAILLQTFMIQMFILLILVFGLFWTFFSRSDAQTPPESGPNTPTNTSEKRDSSVNDENNSQTSDAQTRSESEPNILTSTSEKQDGSLNVPKVDTQVIPKMSSIGKPFDDTFVLNKNNKSLRIPNSAVTLTLSDADLENDMVCLASTFRNLHDIGKKLQLKENEQVASPAVEYVLVESNLKEPATVTMPFIGVPENLQVLKMKSGYGSDLPKRKVLKRKDDVTYVPGEDFFEIIGLGKISITVKSLSWFACISCPERHDLQLTGYLYGRLEYQDPPLDSMVRAMFRLYIADTIHCLEDFKQNMDNAERDHVLLDTFRLHLSAEMLPTACIWVSLQPDSNKDWEHMKKQGSPVAEQPEEQTIPLSSITGCHQSKQFGLPFSKLWYLTSVEKPYRVNCTLTIAEKSDLNAKQTTNRDAHKVETYKLYDHLDQRLARGNVQH